MATVEKPQTAGIPWTDRDKRIWSEIDWAEQNPQLYDQYGDQWIAICDRKVVAHGEDRDQVLREASQVTGRSEDDIAVWVMAGPFFMLQDTPKDDFGL